jgi:CBS domain-containing protein
MEGVRRGIGFLPRHRVDDPKTQPVSEARKLMAQHELDRILLVVEGDRLVGIISEADVRSDEAPLG